MRSPVPDYLDEVAESCADDDSGALAGYIPELASTDAGRLGVALSAVDGTTYCSGDTEVEFSIQSISKPFAYALAIEQHGLDAVLERVGVEPSGEAFNEISVDEETGRPLNPMINAGAITTHAMLGPAEADSDSRAEHAIEGMSAFAGRRLAVDEAVFGSELETAHRNLAIAYMLRSRHVFDQDPAEIVRGYTRQCSANVTARDLALMAATLANGGVQPVTGDRVVSPETVRQVLSVMTTCGMYDAAGDWVSSIGIPAKSGVSGGIIGALPGQVGLATFSPRLDGHGNSVRGVRMCERLSHDMGLHLMGAARPARTNIRATREAISAEGKSMSHYELQGTIQFAGAESTIRELANRPPPTTLVALDLVRVHVLDDVARRMLLEAVRRLTLDGHTVVLIDPEQVLADPDAGDGIRPAVFMSIDDVTLA